MASKDEILAKLIAAVAEKLGSQPPCPLCGHKAWGFGPKFTRLHVTTDPSAVSLGGEGFPLIPMVCNHCGNTHLLNLIVLGFKDLNSLVMDDDAGKDKPK